MSNLTPEDVNLRLTETRNELQLEDTRLWQGLEDERVSRIAGDAANNNLIENTNTALAAQEARLSVEVVQREEGDLRNITSLTELAQALSDYRIKTDLEINNERIARQQLGVDLNTRVDDFVATFDHKFLMVYQTIQTYQTSTTDSINALDLRVKAYEDMLQDITTDSIQITMDNGEINMGVWTILSQARQWDLEILANIKDYKTQTNLNIDEALQDIQNQLPIEQNIINSALDALSNSQIIQNLDAAINSNVADINTLKDDLLQEVSDRQTDMITFSQNINNHLTTNQAHLVSMVEAETAARVNELQREATIRQQALLNEAAERTAEIDEKLTLEEGERLQQIAELQDGLTQEIQHRIDGDNASITALNNYKVSNDAALANVMQDLSANVTATSANTSAITALDTRLTANETVAASAVSKAETALSETTALAGQVDAVKASMDGLETSVNTRLDANASAINSLQATVTTQEGTITSLSSSVTALNSRVTDVEGSVASKAEASVVSALDAKVTTIGGQVDTNTSAITGLTNTVTGIGDTVTAQGSAIDTLQVTQTQQGGELSSLTTKTTTLENKLASVEGTVAANTTAIADTTALVQQQGTDITAVTNSTNSLSAKVNGLKSGGDNLLKNSSEAIVWNASAPAYPHGMYYMSEPWVVGQKYTLTICVSHSSAGGATSLGVFAGGGHGTNVITTFTNTNKEIRTITFTKNAENSDNPAVVFFHLSYSSDPNAQTTVHWAVMTEGESIGVDSWKPGNGDLVAMGEGSATAINNLQAQVNTIDGRVTANTSSVTDLQSTVNNNQANLINNYYTKTNTDIAISNQITSLSATLDMNVLPSKRDTTKQNQWLLTHVVPKDAGWVSSGAGVKPDFSILKTGIKNKRLYCFDDATNLSGSEYDNTVLYFRTTVYVHNDTSVNLGTFTGDDAHSIYVNGVLNLTKEGYGPTENVIISLKQGLNTVDVICYNGIGAAGFTSSVLLSSLVVNMYAPESVEEQAAATANAVSSLTATVSDIDGRVTSNASQVTTLSSTVNNIPSGSGNLLLNPDFTLQNLDFWGIATHGAATENKVLLGNELADWQVHAGQSKTLQLHTLGNIDVATNYYTEVYQDIAIEGGKSYQISAYTGAHRTTGYIFVYFINYQGNLLNHTYGMQPTTSINNNERAGGNFLVNFKRIYQNVTAPGDATSMRIIVRMMAHNDSYLFVTRCAATEVTGSTAALAPWSDSSGSLVYKTNNQQVVINQNTSAVDGIKAISTVSVNNNGFISGYGLISQLVNGVVQSAFGVNADYFYVGTSTSNQKKPFMVLTSPQTIDGVTYPAGTWMDVALIANATIGTAHIADASITNAKIASLDASKITTGTLDANRIAANTITADKLVIGDTTNLWGNQFFLASGPRVMNNNGRVNHVGYITELKGWGAQCFGRDHIAPWSTRIPVKAGDTMVIEFSGGHNAGPLRDVGVGLWYWNGQGVTVAIAYPRLFAIESLGAGWYRYRHTFTVPNDPTIAYAGLFVQIEQSENEADPMYWTIGNTSIRKAMGGELIVNGAITAEKISVNSLSAVSATIGLFKTAPSGRRVEISDNGIRIYGTQTFPLIEIGDF